MALNNSIFNYHEKERICIFDTISLCLHILTAFAGFSFCLISLLIFLKEDFKENLFKLFRIELVFICANYLIASFVPMVCDQGSLSETFIAQFYFVYFLVFLASIVQMSAFYLSIFSAYYCHLLLNEKSSNFQIFGKNVSLKLVVLFVVSLSTILFAYQLFEFEIKEIKKIDEISNTSHSIWITISTDFNKSNLKYYLEILSMIARDGIGILVLIITNLLLYVKVRANINKKKMLIKWKNGESECSTNTADLNQHPISNNLSKSSPDKTKNRITVMIISYCLNCLLGRLPVLVYFLTKKYLNETTSSVFFEYCFVLINISYGLNFFIYYFGNVRFKQAFNQYFRANNK
jgi:hypothetical protein